MESPDTSTRQAPSAESPGCLECSTPEIRSRNSEIPRVFWAYAWSLLAVSIVLEWYVRTHDWFRIHPWIDNPMHFLWGANVCWIGLWALRCRPRVGLLMVLAWQAVWEAGEMIGDRLIVQEAHMIDKLWPDGVKDTVMDLLGGIALLLVLICVHRIRLPLPSWRRSRK